MDEADLLRLAASERQVERLVADIFAGIIGKSAGNSGTIDCRGDLSRGERRTKGPRRPGADLKACGRDAARVEPEQGSSVHGPRLHRDALAPGGQAEMQDRVRLMGLQKRVERRLDLRMDDGQDFEPERDTEPCETRSMAVERPDERRRRIAPHPRKCTKTGDEDAHGIRYGRETTEPRVRATRSQSYQSETPAPVFAESRIDRILGLTSRARASQRSTSKST